MYRPTIICLAFLVAVPGTAVSDDEVFHDPVKGHFWHFQYPIINPQPGEPTHVEIATTLVLAGDSSMKGDVKSTGLPIPVSLVLTSESPRTSGTAHSDRTVGHEPDGQRSSLTPVRSTGAIIRQVGLR